MITSGLSEKAVHAFSTITPIRPHILVTSYVPVVAQSSLSPKADFIMYA